MSYTTWKSANDALNLQGKHVLVVGGTQGIGAGIAIRFSQLGSSVAIAGRNETLANEIISKMKAEAKHSEQDFQFFKVDASLVADLDNFTNEAKKYYESRGNAVDYLVQTHGILNGPLTLTSEGHDRAFMINSYSKWFITDKVQSLLIESSIFICNPASSGSINLEDVELKNTYRFPGTPGKRDGVFLDSMVKEFQERNPTKRFYHIFPGLVDTEIGKNSDVGGLSLVLMRFIGKHFSRTILEFADMPIYFATQDKTGGVSMNEKAKLYPNYSWIKNAENRAKLWTWNEKTAIKPALV